MTCVKRIITSFSILMLLSTTTAFSDGDVKLVPSGNVVEFYMVLKHPYINECLDRNNKKLQQKDIIMYINHDGKKITTLQGIHELMKISNEKIEVNYVRNGKTREKKMSTEDLRLYKVSDYMGATGTITAIDENGNYVALSHNITFDDSELSIDKGILLETDYVQEIKSKDGSIGHLVTTSSSERIGTINSMTKYGLQGKYANFDYKQSKALEIAKPKQGKAYMLCETPITNEIKFHEIEILVVGEKSSKIKILDEELIKIRGGGVQGMSGSPIIQDGRIVGGMSHVYYKDTTLGLIANIHSMLEKPNYNN